MGIRVLLVGDQNVENRGRAPRAVMSRWRTSLVGAGIDEGIAGAGVEGIGGRIAGGIMPTGAVGAAGLGVGTGGGVIETGAVGAVAGGRTMGPAKLPTGACGLGELPPNCMTSRAPETQKPARGGFQCGGLPTRMSVCAQNTP
jgi:hypothetical protein